MTIAPFAVRRALWVVAGLATIAGAALQVTPARSRVEPLAPSVPDTASPVVRPAIDGTAAEEIVLANVFSRTRRAPSTRYVPAEFTTDSASGGMNGGEGGMTAPAPLMTDDADGPRLYGTVVGVDGARALLQLSSASGARLYAAGDRDAGYTVVSVAPREVVLRGPGGRRTLRLEPEERK